MRSAVFVAGLLASAALAFGACSFVTDFPEIETLGGNGSGADNPGGNNTGGDSSGGGGGGGGDGGGGSLPCVTAACENCLTAPGSCPLLDPPIARLLGPPSLPDPGAATYVDIIEIVQKANGPRYIGNFRDAGAAGLETSGATLVMGNQQAGIILGVEGEAIRLAGACDDSGVTGGDEVVFSGATVADDELVIAGVFEGGRMVFSTSTMDCSTSPFVDAPTATGTDFAPFLVWFDAATDTVDRSLEPGTSGKSLENGYLSDVAAMPGGAVGRVAAIGAAGRNPFGTAAAFGGAYQYYVLVTADSSPTALEPLGLGTCGSFSQLDALRSSIAVDLSGGIWAAGTGCTLGQEGSPDRSFLTLFSDDTLQNPETRLLGSTDNPIGITEVAASEAMVIVAGSYSGNPVTLANGDDVPSGQTADGFVMAFTRAGWTNQADPVWFRRIASDGGDARVETLATDGTRVFIGGRMGANGGIGNAEGCWASNAPGRGRSFFAQLDEGTGALDWLHVEGFEAAGAPDLEQFVARGMALLPLSTGGLLTATGSHGEMLLECGDSSTNADGRPEVLLRLFNFQ